MGAWAGFLLAVIFVIAAINKFKDPVETENSISSLGLPFPKLLSSLLPTVELICAVLLAVDPRTGGPCAVALLAAFTTLLVAQILSGNPQNCACFGSWTNKKISSWDLLRNTVLIVLGVLATLD